MYKLIIKPSFDFLFSISAMIILLPIFLLVTILLSFVNSGNTFFFQHRPGLNGKIFKIIKFKTMNDKKDANGNLLSDEVRLTKIGKFVRKTSLDEIPQLLNVIIGDMSLIGPRPLLVSYLDFYSEIQSQRHNVKPGITGWAQVNGRNAIDWNQKFEYDVWYVQNINFLLDVKIFFLTLMKIFITSEISADGHSTMPRFDVK